MRHSRTLRLAIASDSGVGILEIVISMFLLALLTLAFIPVLINTNSLSGKNTTMATATQVVNQQIEAARALSTLSATIPACSVIQGFVTGAVAPVVDPRGVVLQAAWDPITCPAPVVGVTPPGFVTVRVSVTQAGRTFPTASASTVIRVAP